MIHGRVPDERTIANVHGIGVAVDCPTRVSTVVDKRTVLDGGRVAIGIQRPTTQCSRIRIERAVTHRKYRRVGTGDRAAAKVCKVTFELTLYNINRGFYADKDCSASAV